MEIISKQTAIQLNLTKYFTGKKCKHGHLAERYTNGGHCSECKKGHIKEWSENNKEKRLKSSREWKSRNRGVLYERQKEYRANNKHLRQVESKKYREKYPDKVKECKKKAVEKNREHYTVLSRNYTARKKNSEGKHTVKDIRELFVSQNGICNGCGVTLETTGKNKYHVDHIIPLIKGGSNYPSNLQLLCPSCNTSKCDKDFEEWKKYKALISIV